MTKTSKKDFIEIDYVGCIKESNQIFDLTDQDLAKKEKLYDKNLKYGPKIICLGENNILAALDKELVDKEVGGYYKIELKTEDAFGKKDPKLVHIVGVESLIKQKINPFPGLQINASGLLGIIRSVTSGRVTVDFNHPLAGKNLVYEVKINRIVDSVVEKLSALVKNMLNLDNKDFEMKLENGRAEVSLKKFLPVKAKDEVKSKSKELIAGVELVFN